MLVTSFAGKLPLLREIMRSRLKRRKQAIARIRRAVERIYPIEQLERRTLLTGAPTGAPDLSELKSGLDSTFTQANTLIQNTIDASQIPLVGDKLGSAINSLTNLQSSFDSALAPITSMSPASAVMTALQTELNKLGSTATITLVPDTPSTTDEFTVTQTVPIAQQSNASAIPFSLGIPALNLSGSVGFNYYLGYSYSLDFGVDTATGFFISTDSSKTSFNFNASVSIASGSHLTGTLGPLAITATDYPSNDPDKLNIGPTLLTADFTANLAAPDDTGMLTTSTITQATVNMSLTGNANLALVATLGASGPNSAEFPSFQTVFTVAWPFGTIQLNSQGISTQNFGREPEIGFNNISLDFGSAINDVIGPVVNDLYSVLKVVKPIVDFIDDPMPLFNDIPVSALKNEIGTNGDGVITVGTFLEWVAGFEGGDVQSDVQEVVKFAGYIDDIYNLHAAISGQSGVGELNIGSFQIGGDSGSASDISGDLREPGTIANLDLSNLPTDGILGQLDSLFGGAGTDVINALDGLASGDSPGSVLSGDGSSDSTFSMPSSTNFGDQGQFQLDQNPADYGLSFPIITNPGSILGLFLGQNVNLFTFTTPPAISAETLDQYFPILGPLGVEFKGTIDSNDDAFLFGAQFSFGYDTFGLTSGNPLQGFYVNDSDSFVAVDFGVGAFAALDAVIASGGVGGSINANVGLSLNDPNSANDGGRLRLAQIDTDIANDGPFGMFFFGGELTASLQAYIKIGIGFLSVEHDFDIASVTLLDYQSTPVQPTLASEDANGVVTLNLIAANADTSGADQGVDNFTIEDLGPDKNGGEIIDVQADGYDNVFPVAGSDQSGVTQIDGEGEDQPVDLNIDSGVTVPIDIAGGYNFNGSDTETTHNNVQIDDQGSGPVTIYASDGDDDIHIHSTDGTPSAGATIYAEYAEPGGTETDDYNDLFDVDGPLANGATNYIDGGSSNETITGGPGNDSIQAGISPDAVIDAGGGNNTITGSDGNDHFIVNLADQGNDDIEADATSLPGDQNVLEVDGQGGGGNITVGYANGSLTVGSSYNSANSTITISNIQSLDIEPAPGVNPSSYALTLPNGQPAPQSAYPQPTQGTINVTINSLVGSGLSAVYVNMFGSTSGSQTVNPINVNIAGFGNDDVSVVGINTDINDQASTADELYQINSGESGLTVFTTDGPTDTVTYDNGTGSNLIGLDNQIVNPGDITFNSMQGSPGTDTYDIGAAVGSVAINQNGKSIAVNVGSSFTGQVAGPVVTGGLSVIEAPVAITGAIANSNSQSGYDGSIDLTVSDDTGTVGGTGTIGDSSISGFDLGSNTITYPFLNNLFVTLGNHGNTANVDLNGPEGVTIQAGNGGDSIQASASTTPMTLLGGAGNDIIAASSNGDSISGGAGNDFLTEGVLSAHGGDDTIIGGNGSNHIVDDGAVGLIYGNDTTTDGATGANLITGTATALIYTGPGQDAVTFTGGNDETVIAGGGNDSITVGDGVDSINGAGGNDTISAGNGMDTITAGDGNNKISAGDGGDRVTTGNGADSITTGAGDDVIITGNGNSTIAVGAGDDIIYPGGGNNVVNGGSGNDLLISSAGANKVLSNTAVTGTGTTTFTNIERVSLIGIAGNNSFDVSNWTDGPVQITGGSGINTIISEDDADFTLTDSSLLRSDDTAFSLTDIQDAVLTGGPSDNSFTVSGFTGAATLIGGGGVNTVIANDDTNFTLTDTSLARPGDGMISLQEITRALLTAGSSGDELNATGFSGQATLLGGPGNDTLLAGTGGDYLDGGAGHDSLTSSIGADVLVGTSGSGDTLAAGTGGDTIYSSNSADTILGQPAIVNPNLPPNGPTYSVPGATLPTGGDQSGPWAEYSGSASGGGVSNTTNAAISPVIAADATGQFVAWADNRSGTYQIYVTEHTGSVWEELAGSAQGGGISNAPTGDNALQPTIALDSSGNPIVAWTQSLGAATIIHVVRYDPTANSGTGGWVSMGSTVFFGGFRATSDPQVVETSDGPVVAWLDDDSGIMNVYVAAYNGSSWAPFESSDDTGSGVTKSSTPISQYSLATDGTHVAIAWTQLIGRTSYIYLLEQTGGTWAQVNNSASGSGVSGSIASAAQPSVAFDISSLYVAWQSTSASGSNISAATASGGGWTPVSITAPGSTGHSANPVNFGQSSQPQLAAADGWLSLVWTEIRLASSPNETTAIYAERLGSSGFAPQLPNDANFDGIGQTMSAVSSIVLAVDPSGHPFVAWGDDSSGTPQVYVRGDTLNVNHIYYVNDSLSDSDSFTTAAGSSSNSGTSPSSPLNSVQAVLNEYMLGPGDVVLVDGGSYSGFTVPSADNGFLILGSAGVPAVFTSAVSITNGQSGTLEDLTLSGGLTITASTAVEIRNDNIAALTVAGGTNVRIDDNNINSGLTIEGGASGILLAGDTISGAAAVTIGSGGATGLGIQDNNISGTNTGLAISTTASGTIIDNDISGAGVGLQLSAVFTGPIEDNNIYGSGNGVVYAVGALLIGNRIFDNTTGIADTVNSSTTGLGFVAGSTPNLIYQNSTGVQLTGLMQGQDIYTNVTGVSGSGVLGGTDLDSPNVIETNFTGINFAGTVQYNRIDRNTITIVVQSGQLIDHNIFYDNANNQIETLGATDVRIVNNTFYASSGDSVHVDGASSNVQVLNNIFQSSGGYDLYVADDSRSGFFSDYNDLYTTGSAKIVHWLIDFTDILDWQRDVGLYDQHSIGTTTENPTAADPMLFQPTNDDFRVLPVVNGQRTSSPVSGAADPETDLGLPAGYQNLLSNPSFESGLSGWTTDTSATTQTTSPAPFDGLAYFTAGQVSSGFAQQTISLTAAGYSTAQLDAEDLDVSFGGRIRSAAETPADQGTIVLTFLNSSGGAIGTPVTLAATNVSDRWELVGARVHVPMGARSIEYQFLSQRGVGDAGNSYLDSAFVYVLSDAIAPSMGAYGNTAAEFNAQNTPAPHAARLIINSPDLYVNWVANQPHAIRWTSFGNDGDLPVRIDLYQNNVLVTNIVLSTADNGLYMWTPTGNQIGLGYRIIISLVGSSSASDQSTETFAVVSAGSTFYVNDSKDSADQYTTAAGSNRNTGQSPADPLPSLAAVLATYSVGSGDTIYIDNGNYSLFNPIVLSGNPALGTGAGATIIGPTNGGTASLSPLGFSGEALIDVDAAPSVTLSHLTLNGGLYGVWVNSGSTSFTGSYITANGTSSDGIHIDSSSTGANVDHITVSNDGGSGLFVGGSILTVDHVIADNDAEDGVEIGAVSSVTNSSADHDALYGFFLSDVAGAVLTNDEGSFDNVGLLIEGTAVVGSTNLAASLGNIFHDNSALGIDAGGNVTVADDVVYNTTGISSIGIGLGEGATAIDDVVYNGVTGVEGGSVSFSRIYDQSVAGIVEINQLIQGNVLFGNGVGIEAQGGGTLLNNLIYDDTTTGVMVSSLSATQIINNTIYELTGTSAQSIADGIDDNSSAPVAMENNIVEVDGGYAINVAAAAEAGFQSNYNLLFVAGTGNVGKWEGVARPTLAAWQSASDQDANSISSNPLLVDPTTGDFHESSATGSFHGGSLAVVMGSGAYPVAATGVLTSDGSVTSPAVDAGDPSSSYANEPTPNGARVNLGAYGNTAQASESAVGVVQVLKPAGGDIDLIGRNLPITWHSDVTTGTVTIQLLQSGSPVLTIASSANNSSQSLNWVIPSSVTPGGNYTIQITINSNSATGTSPAFAFAANTHTFYVNDASSAVGDWTTAPGSDANSGLDAQDPKATLQALLAAYPLGSGDTILVDAGTYNLTTSILLGIAHSGITIEGYNNSSFPGRAATLIRSNTAAGSYLFDVEGATNVTLEDLVLTGGYNAVNAGDNSDSTGLTIANDSISGALNDDIYIGSDDTQATITTNQIQGAADAIFASDSTVAITGNFISASGTGVFAPQGSGPVTGNTIFGNSGDGIEDLSATVSGNIVYSNKDAGINDDTGTISGNTVYGTIANPQMDGIDSIGAQISGNIVYSNTNGITVSGLSSISNNRVYSNSRIDISAAGTLTGNVIYDSGGWGIQLTATAALQNNLVYNNASGGIWFSSQSGSSSMVNNTIYQTTGDALRLSGTAMQMRNNIFWDSAGYDVRVDSSSPTALSSDYNLFYSTGSGVGLLGTTINQTLSTWQLTTSGDADSISADPVFVNPANGDFHEQSTIGSFHGASLAPVLNAITNLPTTPALPSPTADQNQSPAIDRGSPADSVGAEPAPNGAYINLGAFGGTSQASLSPASYMLVTQPNGGQDWTVGQQFTILWRTQDTGSTVEIDLVEGSNITLIATAAPNTGQYVWTIPSSVAPASDYRIKVTRNDSGVNDTSDATFSIAAATHVYYVNDGTVVAGDWTTAPGSDTNSNTGDTPADPKASIAGVLAAHTLFPGDIIMVDDGSYTLTADVVLTLADSGVRIEGYNNPSFPTRSAIINGNSGAFIFSLAGATNVTIDHLTFENALIDIDAAAGANSTGVNVSDNLFMGSVGGGFASVELAQSDDNWNISGNTIQSAAGNFGISVSDANNTAISGNIITGGTDGVFVSTGSGTSITGNTVSGAVNGLLVDNSTVMGNTIHDNTSRGIDLNTGSLATENTVYNQTQSNDIGIEVAGPTDEARSNIVHDNATGIFSFGTTDNNRVFHNSVVGINAQEGSTFGNSVYSNGVGIEALGSESLTSIHNNVIYANSTIGLWIASTAIIFRW
jgi:parallel beta-helix repeat protein